MFERNEENEKLKNTKFATDYSNTVIGIIIVLSVLIGGFVYKNTIIAWANNAVYQNIGKPYYSLKYKIFPYPIAYTSKADKNLLSDNSLMFFWTNLKLEEKTPVLAENNLGVFFEKNKEINDAKIKAFYWYNKSAEGGFPIGQYNLARMFLINKNISQNQIIAFAWLRLAAKSGLTDAKHLLDYVTALLNKNQQNQGNEIYKVFYKNFGNKILLGNSSKYKKISPTSFSIIKQLWMKTVRPLNPNYSDKEMSDYYDKKYGFHTH